MTERLIRWGPVAISVLALGLVFVFRQQNIYDRYRSDLAHAAALGVMTGEIKTLSAQLEREQTERRTMQAYLFKLNELMIRAGIEPPDLPRRTDHE